MPKSRAVLDLRSLRKNDDHIEERFSWDTGSVLMRTQGADSSCNRNFFRDDIAIGIIVSEDSGSDVTWHLDGRLVLDKTWTSSSASHDMVVLAPGCELRAECHGAGQGLWLFIDPASCPTTCKSRSLPSARLLIIPGQKTDWLGPWFRRSVRSA